MCVQMLDIWLVYIYISKKSDIFETIFPVVVFANCCSNKLTVFFSDCLRWKRRSLNVKSVSMLDMLVRLVQIFVRKRCIFKQINYYILCLYLLVLYTTFG